MADMGHRAGRGLVLLLGTLVLVGCSGTPAPASAPLAHPTAVAACTDALGKAWQVAVEVDRAAGSTLALVSGDSISSCQTWLNDERTDFVITSAATGLYPTSSPLVLSYLTGGGNGNLTSFFVGRVPPSANAVRVTFADGSEHDAVLGGGLWLAWLEQPADAEPTAIEALDAGGTVISRLADANGIQARRLTLDVTVTRRSNTMPGSCSPAPQVTENDCVTDLEIPPAEQVTVTGQLPRVVDGPIFQVQETMPLPSAT